MVAQLYYYRTMVVSNGEAAVLISAESRPIPSRKVDCSLVNRTHSFQSYL